MQIRALHSKENTVTTEGTEHTEKSQENWKPPKTLNTPNVN